jgi:hypothetical protein
MEHFKKLMDKKRSEGKGKMGDVESAARGSVLQDMIGALDQDGMKKVKGIKKVTVASNSEGGVKEGLDAAKSILAQGEKRKASGSVEEGEMTPDSQEEEYDDQDAEGPNHMPTEKEASSFGSQDPKLGSPETDEGTELAEHDESEDMDLHEEIKNLKAEIASLRAPKSFY